MKKAIALVIIFAIFIFGFSTSFSTTAAAYGGRFYHGHDHHGHYRRHHHARWGWAPIIGAFIGGAIIGGFLNGNGGANNGYYNNGGGRFYIGPGGYRGYYYTGQMPIGGILGTFLARIPAEGGFYVFWWPEIIVPVSGAYYNGHPYPAVIEVPSGAETSVDPQQEGFLPANRCYVPKIDQYGNFIRNNGNMIPDFGRPVPCP